MPTPNHQEIKRSNHSIAYICGGQWVGDFVRLQYLHSQQIIYPIYICSPLVSLPLSLTVIPSIRPIPESWHPAS